MRVKSVFRDVVIIALSFSGLQIFHTLLLKNALLEQERAGTYRLQSGISGVLNKAHKAKDDIVIYEVLSALAQTPGIIQARIVDPETEITAEPGLYSYSLQDGFRRWGELILSISDHLSRQLLRRQLLVGMAASGLIWATLFAYLQYMEQKKSALCTQVAELDGLLQTEKKKYVSSQEREQKSHLQAVSSLQEAVRRISYPLLVLDSQQRVEAINQSALSCLKIEDQGTVLRKSWQEVSVLCSCGSTLEQSLASPGESVEWSSPGSDLHAIFETGIDGLAGTWVTFLGARDVVK